MVRKHRLYGKVNFSTLKLIFDSIRRFGNPSHQLWEFQQRIAQQGSCLLECNSSKSSSCMKNQFFRGLRLVHSSLLPNYLWGTFKESQVLDFSVLENALPIDFSPASNIIWLSPCHLSRLCSKTRNCVCIYIQNW